MKDGGRVKDREIKQKRPTQRNRETDKRQRHSQRLLHRKRDRE